MNSPPTGKSLKFFDLGSVCLALALAFAASLPLLTTLRERRDFYLFEITLTSTESGLTRLAWDSGHGFSEHDSSAQPLASAAKPTRYLYLLPTGTLRALRFYPIDRHAHLILANARVVDRRGAILHAFTPADFVTGSQITDAHVRETELRVETSADATEPFFELRLDHPLALPLHRGLWLRTAAPVFLPVFALGLLLSSPWFLSQAGRISGPATAWASRNPTATLLLVSILAAVVQAHPVVFRGRSFVSPNNGSSMLYGRLPTLPGYTDPLPANTMGSDVGALFFHHLYSPMVQHDALAQGEWPLWNRYNLTGTPLLGQGQSMWGDPLNLITVASHGASWAWDLRFVLARVLFAFGLGLCVRSLTHDLGASLLVALSAPFIGFFLFRINHPANFSVCYSPWILWGWIGYIQAESRKAQAGWLGILVLANGWVMTSGTVKEAYMLMACLDAAGVILLLLLPASVGRRGTLLFGAAGAGFVFILLSAPFWGSFLITLQHSFTVYDKPAAQTLSLHHIIGFFDEIFYRQGSSDERVVDPALNFFYLLGVLWWLSRPTLWSRDRAGLALAIAAGIPLSLAFGLVPAGVLLKIPFVGNIYHVGNTFSCPAMVLCMLLAGCGFHDVRVQLQTAADRTKSLATVALAGVALVGIYFATTTAQSKSLFFIGYGISLGFATFGLLLGVGGFVRGRRASLLAVALGLGLPLLLWRHGQYRQSIFNRYVFTPGLRTDFFTRSPALEEIDRDRREPTRLVGLQYNLFPTYNVALGWESLYGVDALRNHAYEELIRSFGLVRVWDWEQPNALGNLPAQRAFYDFLNVGYYLADPGTAADQVGDLRPVAHADLDVFASPSTWPRAFFSDQLASYRSVEEFATTLRHSDGRPMAAIEINQPERGKLPSRLTGRTTRAATHYRLTANTTTFVIEAPSAGVAVLTEAYLPDDFTVTVNGQPSTYFRVNHAFKGVLLPSAGTYQITFAYRPKYFTLMLGLSALGVIAAAGLGFILGRDGRAKAGSIEPSREALRL